MSMSIAGTMIEIGTITTMTAISVGTIADKEAPWKKPVRKDRFG
jgi:hypothetical protein